MDHYGRNAKDVAKELGSDLNDGLGGRAVNENRVRYGTNVITESKGKGIVRRIFDALTEPMMLILCFALAITFGINVGKLIKGVQTNFYECLGIVIAIAISVTLTIVMEGKSQKAFKLLGKLGDDGAVKVIRGGKETIVKRSDVVVGDVIILEAGDKVCADALIAECFDFSVDQSMLTGESKPAKKTSETAKTKTQNIAEIKNAVFSGTFVSSGYAKALVINVGDKAETGKLARDVLEERTVSAPLEEKLSKLGKTVTVFGSVCAALVFILSVVRLAILGKVDFLSVENVFVEAVVLIVAAVPEGLPTTVAISLTLNVVKLARSNALIKKLVATETVGCVSVICSDKTGTLTQNKMLVEKFVVKGVSYSPEKMSDPFITLNCAANTTAHSDGNFIRGSATEGALILALASAKKDYLKLRREFIIEKTEPFSSEKKSMETKGLFGGRDYDLIKGAPEKILAECDLSGEEKQDYSTRIALEQKKGKRVLAFAHRSEGKTIFDGYAVLSDRLRNDVKQAVSDCLRAGVGVKIITGDNIETARSVAIELGLPAGEKNVVSAEYIDGLDENALKNVLPDITVIARSLPQTKLKVVKTLQKMGEVVAVTGDGVNDAPAIKHADIGIAMGSGSEITKEAGDVVLLDNSFSTILKAISFGRNVYGNFQRFITFQLTVNLASMSIIIAYLLMGFESPFTSTCLLWLNVIMDGPLALSLGLEQRPLNLENSPIVRRSESIISKKTFVRIILHSAFMCSVVALQKIYDFLGASAAQEGTVVITTFVFFQLFNALNCREVGSESVFKNMFANKLFIATFVFTFVLHVILTEVFPDFFKTTHLEFSLWLKIVALCSSVFILSEFYKLVYRLLRKKNKLPKIGVIDRARLA